MTEHSVEARHGQERIDPANDTVRVDEYGETGLALRVSGLTRYYGQTRAVDDLDLDIRPGEFVVLLGLNGAGKTTLFQMLTGLFLPDEGTASIAGCDIRHQPVEALASLGVVFQQPTIDLDMTVLRNLRFQARLHGLPRGTRERRIKEVLSLIDLAQQAREPVRTLSGGNRRRVELARALLHEPSLLLMDEPTVGLDPATRTILLEQVRALCRERNMAVLWATHLVDEAEDADRIVVMHHGKLIADSAPQQLLSKARAHSLTEAFHALTGHAELARGVTA